MKIKQGFVTNSSSTAFLFYIKEDYSKSHFEAILQKYSGDFKLAYDFDDFEATPKEIIDALIDVTENNRRENSRGYSTPDVSGNTIASVDDLLKEEIETMQEYAVRVDEDENEERWRVELLEEARNEVAYLKALKILGFKTRIQIYCGDSEGDISGRGIGPLMDYNNKYWKRDEPDVIISTRSNR